MSVRERRLFYVMAVSLCLTGGAVAAEEPEAICDEADNNAALKQCLADVYEKADAELNAVWKQVLASVNEADYLTPDQREAWETELREAQRAWVQFKEHDCSGAVLYEWWGGSGAGAAISSCLLGHTKARTADLKDRYLAR